MVRINGNTQRRVTSSTSPSDTDSIISVTTGKSLRKTTWSNIKATLKIYFDTIYNNYILPVASSILGGVKSGGDITVDGEGNVTVNNSDTLDGLHSSDFSTKYGTTERIFNVNMDSAEGYCYLQKNSSPTLDYGTYLVDRQNETHGGLKTTLILKNGSVVLAKANYEGVQEWAGKVWHENNDGSGSGLDADKIDGLHGSQLVRNDIPVPASATSPGKKGQVSGDANYFYYCYDTNSWARYAKSTKSTW